LKLTPEYIYCAYQFGAKALMQLLERHLGDTALAVQFTPSQKQELIKDQEEEIVPLEQCIARLQEEVS
jgi:hypothetical protein